MIMQQFYYPLEIEKIVQFYWEKQKTFKVTRNKNKKKYYCLSMIPYPSGKIHIGHVRNYTISDVISRYQRMLGKNVLQPIGWDAFGLPAEEAAIQNNIEPSAWTYLNIKNMKTQLKSLGFSYDWSREIITCDPKYYHWEQWFFIYLYKKKLVYKKKALVNWCPIDKTVLANEQVINNCCWRCNSKIKYKNMYQWFMKITNYADELINELDKLKDWPKTVKDMQRNWIGRSNGIEIIFKILNSKKNITIYTTRPDMLMGVTYISIAINHSLLTDQAILKNIKLIKFIKKYSNKKIIENNFKGIHTGVYAIHPLNGDILPVWLNNIILTDYGTGAIMGVPGHNLKDLNFANKYNISIKFILQTNNGITTNISNKNIIKKGILFNSGKFNGLHSDLANKIITNELISLGIGKKATYYKLRDWGISRQRYWGVPIPMIILKNGKIIPVKNNKLPVILPKNSINFNNFNPLKDNKWKKINNSTAIKETDTFDTFMESSWYYARYTCPNYNKGMLDINKANYWLPVDQYIGGIEHATMHLIYFRFYHKLLRDANLVNSNEPVKKLLCQGMVLSNAFYYIDEQNKHIWVSTNQVKIKRNTKGKIIQALDNNGKKLNYAGMVKMSKSKKNGIDPQIIINKYGADTLRLFIMFAAPVKMSLEWNEKGIEGSYRFLKRIWKLVYEHIKLGPVINLNLNKLNDYQKKIQRTINKTISKVTDDINNRQSFNTAIAEIMKLTNKLSNLSQLSQENRFILREALKIIIKMLYPFTPHICFILWKNLTGKKNIDFSPWPKVNKSILEKSSIAFIIQINNKFKEKIEIPINLEKIKIMKIIDEKKILKKYLKDKTIEKIFFKKNKLINIII